MEAGCIRELTRVRSDGSAIDVVDKQKLTAAITALTATRKPRTSVSDPYGMASRKLSDNLYTDANATDAGPRGGSRFSRIFSRAGIKSSDTAMNGEPSSEPNAETTEPQKDKRKASTADEELNTDLIVSPDAISSAIKPVSPSNDNSDVFQYQIHDPGDVNSTESIQHAFANLRQSRSPVKRESKPAERRKVSDGSPNGPVDENPARELSYSYISADPQQVEPSAAQDERHTVDDRVEERNAVPGSTKTGDESQELEKSNGDAPLEQAQRRQWGEQEPDSLFDHDAMDRNAQEPDEQETLLAYTNNVIESGRDEVACQVRRLRIPTAEIKARLDSQLEKCSSVITMLQDINSQQRNLVLGHVSAINAHLHSVEKLEVVHKATVLGDIDVTVLMWIVSLDKEEIRRDIERRNRIRLEEAEMKRRLKAAEEEQVYLRRQAEYLRAKEKYDRSRGINIVEQRLDKSEKAERDKLDPEEEEMQKFEKQMGDRLAQAGFKDSQIKELVDARKIQQPSTIDSEMVLSRPIYYKTNKIHLEEATLKWYDIPYEIDHVRRFPSISP